MQLELYTAATDEPVSLDQAREHLRVVTTEEDSYLLGLIAAARRLCEQRTGRILVTQTWTIRYDSFGEACGAGWEIALPLSPVQSITHLKYYDWTDTLQTLSAANYQLAKGLSPRLVPAIGKSWPATSSRLQAIEIRAVCGFGEADEIPDELVQWMLLHIAHWFENREAFTLKELSPLPFVDGLLDRESRMVVG
jgi:uncharacterized phiE125 gp8 family phage protein